jgi:hypothetical protein
VTVVASFKGVVRVVYTSNVNVTVVASFKGVVRVVYTSNVKENKPVSVNVMVYRAIKKLSNISETFSAALEWKYYYDQNEYFVYNINVFIFIKIK